MRKQKSFFAIILIIAIFGVISPIKKVEAEDSVSPRVENALTEENSGDVLISPNPNTSEEQEEVLIMPETETAESTPPVETQNFASPEDVASLQQEQEENITAEDLGVEDQTVLPDQKIAYSFKNLWRGILMATTINPVKRAGLKLQFANEKLIEARKIAEKTGDSAIIENAIDKYKEEIKKTEEKIAKIKDRNDEKVDKLLEKIADNQIKHAILIDKIKSKLSEENQEKLGDKIEEAKNRVLGDLSGAALKISNPEKMRERLQNAIENQAGSDLKQIKHMEVLKRIEEKAPEEAKKAIQKVQEKTIERFQEKASKIKDLKTKAEIANPASVFCVNKGGKVRIKKDAEGNEFGICALPDGQECDEWKLFRGECKAENINTTSDPSLELEQKICTQIITPAKNPKTGECKEFSTPCDVPAGWLGVAKCEQKIITPEKINTLREKIENKAQNKNGSVAE